MQFVCSKLSAACILKQSNICKSANFGIHINGINSPLSLFMLVKFVCLLLRGFHVKNCSQVDPIVASFSGGAVGVISALMVVEVNNVKQQEHKRCKYCLGTGMVMALNLV